MLSIVPYAVPFLRIHAIRREIGGGGLNFNAAAYMLLKRRKKEEKIKWECVEVGHHRNVGRTIEEWEGNGWTLFSYNAAGNPGAISHYLLFMLSE